MCLNCRHRPTFWRKRRPKVHAEQSYAKFCKSTKIAHFLRFCIGGTKGKSPEKQADNKGLKNTPAQIPLPLNQYARKVQTSANILAQTAAPKVQAEQSYAKVCKSTKIAHFLRFCIGGTKGKSPEKQADNKGLKNTPAQIALPLNQYVLKLQTSANILAQTAAPKVHAEQSCAKFCKSAKIAHFLRFCIGGTKGKSPEKQADNKGLKNIPAQIPLPLNQYARKVQTSANILARTAAPKVHAEQSYAKVCKSTKIAHFLRFCIGGTKGKSPEKQADNKGLKNTPAQIPPPLNQYARKVQTSAKILVQTAAPKVHAEQSYAKVCKSTKIAHFLRFCIGGTKGKSPEMQADNKGLKNTTAQIPLPLNQYARKVQTSANILAQTAAPKVHAEQSYANVCKSTKIAHFLRFCIGGTKGKSPEKQADNKGLKITPAQIALPLNQYVLKLQTSANILAQTAAPKVHAEQSCAKFCKSAKIAHFPRFCIGGTKGKSPEKQADNKGLKNIPAQIPLPLNQYARKVQTSVNILARTAALKVHAEQSYAKVCKSTKIAHFLRFCIGGTKGKSREKQADNKGLKNTPAQIPPPLNQYARKVQTSAKIMVQTAAPKVHAEQSYAKVCKSTKIAHFLRFCIGGTKGKSPEKQADNKGLKNIPAQIPLPLNQYARKVQTSANILARTAAPKVHAEQSYAKVCKSTKIAHFLRFCIGGTKGKSPEKQADNKGLKNTPAQIPPPLNQYARKVQTSAKILVQTAAPKVHAEQSYAKVCKSTKIAHFLRFCIGGTKGKSPEMQADNKGLKNTPAQIPLPLNQYARKVQTSANILAQTAAPKVHAEQSYANVCKSTKIAHFLRFCIGGTKGKSPEKQADNKGLKNTPAQIALPLNQYVLKLQTSANILAQTAAPKVHAEQSCAKFCKSAKIAHFPRFCIGGTKGKSPEKQADNKGLKNIPAQIPLPLNQYARKVQTSVNILARTAALKVHAEQSYAKVCKSTKIAHFLRFCIGGTKGKSREKQADNKGLKNTPAQIPPPLNQYARKVQTSAKIMVQTAAPKVHAEQSYAKVCKSTKIAHFLRFCIGGTKGKSPEKEAENKGLKNTPAQIALPLNQYAGKVQTSANILAQTAAPKVHAEQSYAKFCKSAKIAHFLRFRIGGPTENRQKSRPTIRA